MHRGFLKTAALLGALSVALGAFGAHKLKDMVSLDAVEIFETAVRYQFYHVFGLLAVGILYATFKQRVLQYSGIFFIAGIILFCGSLYGLTFVKAANVPDMKWLGPVTPLGGLCFIIGWVLLFASLTLPKK